ncbi:MAG: shikimate kinase [Phycisphaerales bacterium]
MTTRTNVILIGLRGSGKSTTGRLIAKELGHAFVDLDDATALEMDATDAGAAIRDHGIDAFRRAEARALERELDADATVLALGGGTPTAPGAAQLIRNAYRRTETRVLYLRAEPETLLRRIESDETDRPALVGGPPLAEIRQLFEERDPLYRELADEVIDADTLAPADVAERVARALDPC